MRAWRLIVWDDYEAWIRLWGGSKDSPNGVKHARVKQVAAWGLRGTACFEVPSMREFIKEQWKTSRQTWLICLFFVFFRLFLFYSNGHSMPCVHPAGTAEVVFEGLRHSNIQRAMLGGIWSWMSSSVTIGLYRTQINFIRSSSLP